MNDIICAIATPYGSGAISIIRVSGMGSVEKINSVFKGKDLTKMESHTVTYGHIFDKEVIDEVMVIIMRAPKTFTTEDTVEINCHGGVYVTNRVLQTLLAHGMRLAEPGEFSKRAFLAGRIDLVQAEAIMDMVSAKNKLALNVANQGINKRISLMVEKLKKEILDIIVDIEVNIDYPEYSDLPEVNNRLLKERISNVNKKMVSILAKSQGGKLIREGIKTVIIGKPNVGKSSILNILLDEEKAIVSDIEGTTRDYIEGYVNVGGVTLNLVDTAGIREAHNEIEKIGISRSIGLIDQAELVLLILDNSKELSLEDKEILEKTKDKKRIVIVNKKDLTSKLSYKGDIYISAMKQDGIDELEEKILEVLNLNDFNYDDNNYLSNVRHIDLMTKAKKSLDESMASIDQNMEIDMIEIDIKEAFNLLGEIVGENSTELIIDSLFKRFCLGK